MIEEESELSLQDALLWRKCEIVSATDFVAALHFWQLIDEKQALEQFHSLIVYGLPVHDKLEPNLRNKDPERWAYFQELVIEAIIAKATNIQSCETDDDPLPDFENIIIMREEAFKLFKILGISTLYPWPYPLGMEAVREAIVNSVRKKGEPEEQEEILNEEKADEEATKKSYENSPPIASQENSPPMETTNTTKNQTDGLANNRERGSARKLIGALLQLYYGLDVLSRDPEIIADELIADFDTKEIEIPLLKQTLIKWIIDSKKAISVKNK